MSCMRFKRSRHQGSKTARTDIDLVRDRLKRAREDFERMREAEEKEAKVSEERITRGSGNVFSDLGMPDAGERQTKTRLAMAINEIIASRKLRQVDAAKVLNIPQPRVSALLHYRLKVFSVEKLLDLLTRLDQDVEIMIRPRARKGAGAVSVLTVR
jgi:predicted XRE-type DNA-binding protein